MRWSAKLKIPAVNTTQVRQGHFQVKPIELNPPHLLELCLIHMNGMQWQHIASFSQPSH